MLPPESTAEQIKKQYRKVSYLFDTENIKIFIKKFAQFC